MEKFEDKNLNNMNKNDNNDSNIKDNESVVSYNVTDDTAQAVSQEPANMPEDKTAVESTDTLNSGGTAEKKSAASSATEKPARSKVVLNNKNGTGKSNGKLKTWQKGLIIFLIIVVVIGVGTARCASFFNDLMMEESSVKTVDDLDYDYIGVVYVEGTISEYLEDTYDHEYVMSSIDDMIYDNDNKGLILYVETPGGSVFASDELYFKILEYKEKTGRPVYSSMQSQATSGGYYVSAPCDKIIANRNCWTGSIGVTMGTFMDVSELLDNLGVKTETITSGDNKAMGSSYEAMTDEQRAIFQSLIDEAYDQFVGIVAEGRNMPVERVKELADGRIYTAKQALEVDLIDAIGTYEEAVEDMMAEYNLSDCAVEEFEPEYELDLFTLLGSAESLEDLKGIIDADTIQELTELNGKVTIEYKAEVCK